MPKATVNENGRMVDREDEIRLARDVLRVESVTKAPLVECFPNRELRLGVRPANPGHHPGAGRLVNDVGHFY